MKQANNTAARLLVVSVLHWVLTYYLFHWRFAGRPKSLGYLFPHELVLTLAGASVVCLIVLVPVLLKGDSVQRLLAVGLMALPVLSLRVALNRLIPFLIYAYD